MSCHNVLISFKIEQWCERNYPSFVILQSSGHSLDESDARARIAQRDVQLTHAVRRRKQAEELAAGGAGRGANGVNGDAVAVQGQDLTTKEVILTIGGLLLAAVALASIIVWVIIKYFS